MRNTTMTTATTTERSLEEPNYADLKVEVDALLQDLLNERDNIDKRRKRLLEQSREFKMNTSKDVLKLVAPLFKSFRTVVDDLYQSNKHVEAALLKTCPKLMQLHNTIQLSRTPLPVNSCLASLSSMPHEQPNVTPDAISHLGDERSPHQAAPFTSEEHFEKTRVDERNSEMRAVQSAAEQISTQDACVASANARAASKSLDERLKRAESELEIKDKRITQLTEEVRKLRAALSCFASREPFAISGRRNIQSRSPKANYSPMRMHKPPMTNQTDREAERMSSNDCSQINETQRLEMSEDASGERTNSESAKEGQNAAVESCSVAAGEACCDQLDTVEIAARVRQALLENNIGQRVFAKFVLNLSQGTLSELMSKPKRWDKLTEKGRESYRKMLNWLAAIDVNVAKLKLLIPKKNALVSNLPSQAESPATAVECASPIVGQARKSALSSLSDVTDSTNSIQMKVMQILEEVRVEMQRKKELNNSSSALNSTNFQPSHLTEPELRLNHESRLVRRVYIEQLAKLVQKAAEFGRQEDVAEYQHQLDAALKQETADEAADLVTPNITLPHSLLSNMTTVASPSSTAQSQKASMLMQAVLTGSDKSFGDAQVTSSPLIDWRAQLAPLLFSKTLASDRIFAFPTSASAESLPTCAAPTALSPLSPPEDQQSPLNLTVVSKTAIGKRVTVPSSGHCKLDLRMNNDPAAQIRTIDETSDLVANFRTLPRTDPTSHWILPEHSLATSHGHVNDLLSRLKSLLQLAEQNNTEVAHLQSQEQLRAFATFAQQAACSLSQETLSISKYRCETNSRTPSPASLNATPCNYNAFNVALPTQVSKVHAIEDSAAKENPVATVHNATLSPNVDELALDTNALTSQVRDLLAIHSVGQKLFGEFVLGLSQGSVSEILSKPKAWNVLSAKGREPYVKMRRWLDDPHAIDRLKQCQTASRLKRDRSLSPSDVTDSRRFKRLRKPTSLDDSAPAASPNNSCRPVQQTSSKITTAEMASSAFKGRRHKGHRVMFSEEQKAVLNRTFEDDPYPSQQLIHSLAKRIGVTVRTIVNWFHNHRVRSKHYQSMKQAHQMRRKQFTHALPTGFHSAPSPATSLCIDSTVHSLSREPNCDDQNTTHDHDEALNIDKKTSVAESEDETLNFDSDISVQANDCEERSEPSDDQSYLVAHCSSETHGNQLAVIAKSKRKSAQPHHLDAAVLAIEQS